MRYVLNYWNPAFELQTWWTFNLALEKPLNIYANCNSDMTIVTGVLMTVRKTVMKCDVVLLQSLVQSETGTEKKMGSFPNEEYEEFFLKSDKYELAILWSSENFKLKKHL